MLTILLIVAGIALRTINPEPFGGADTLGFWLLVIGGALVALRVLMWALFGSIFAIAAKNDNVTYRTNFGRSMPPNRKRNRRGF